MLFDFTFDEAVDAFREELKGGRYGSQRYQDAVNTISYLWDEDRVRAINEAVAPVHDRPLTSNERVYILMDVQRSQYCILGRDQMAMWVQYG